MATIFLPADDYSVWRSIGNALGTWGGNRLADIQRTNQAKEYANAYFRPEQGAVVQDDQQQLPAIQGGGIFQQIQNNRFNKPGILHDAQAAAQAVLNAPAPQTDNAITQAPSAVNDAVQSVMPQVNFNATTTQAGTQPAVQAESNDQPQTPSAPNRAQIRAAMRQQNGNKYGDLYVSTVKAGYTPEQARAMTLAQWKEDEDNAYNTQADEYRKQVLEPERNAILQMLLFTTDKNGNPVVDTYNSSKVKGLIPAINDYNQKAALINDPGLSLTTLNNEAKLNKPNTALTQGKNGHFYRYDKDNGTLTDIADASDPRERYIQTTAGLYDTKTNQFITDPVKAQQIAIAIRNADRADRQEKFREDHYQSGGSGTRNGVNSATISALSRQHAQWVKNNWDKDETESPYYQPLQNALGISGSSGGGEQAPNRGYAADENKMSSAIMDSYYHNGHDATINLLHKHGWYNYDSWVPDDK